MQYNKNDLWKNIFLGRSKDISPRYQTKTQYSASKSGETCGSNKIARAYQKFDEIIH